MLFTFPEDARWNTERQAGEFGIEIGEYRGVVRVPRRDFNAYTGAAHPERRVEGHHPSEKLGLGSIAAQLGRW